MTTATAPTDFSTRHRDLLERAREAIRSRAFYSAFPESAKAYGENAAADGSAAFEARLGRPFALAGATTGEFSATERSPFGRPLDVRYAVADIDAAIAAAGEAMRSWGAASVDVRAGVALEALARINAHSFEMAHAVMHTTGQAFMMAFQAGGPPAAPEGGGPPAPPEAGGRSPQAGRLGSLAQPGIGTGR